MLKTRKRIAAAVPLAVATGYPGELARRQVRVLYLPPYSPGFNLIECRWSQVKAYLRIAKARTFSALLQSGPGDRPSHARCLPGLIPKLRIRYIKMESELVGYAVFLLCPQLLIVAPSTAVKIAVGAPSE